MCLRSDNVHKIVYVALISRCSSSVYSDLIEREKGVYIDTFVVRERERERERD